MNVNSDGKMTVDGGRDARTSVAISIRKTKPQPKLETKQRKASSNLDNTKSSPPIRDQTKRIRSTTATYIALGRTLPSGAGACPLALSRSISAHILRLASNELELE